MTGETDMNNSSLISADSATHVKIVAVSLLAGILVIGIGIAARPNFNDGASAFNRVEASGPVIKAGKPTAFSAHDAIVIR
jgi:hypothetical protein